MYSTCPVWLFGRRPRLDTFQVSFIRPSLSSLKQNGVVTSIKEHGGLPWQESMFYRHFLALPAPYVSTMCLRAKFSFRLPIPAIVSITSVPLSIIPLHPIPNLPISLYLILYQKQISRRSFTMTHFFFSFGVYTTYLSLLKHSHPDLQPESAPLPSHWSLSSVTLLA